MVECKKGEYLPNIVTVVAITELLSKTMHDIYSSRDVGYYLHYLDPPLGLDLPILYLECQTLHRLVEVHLQ